MPYITHFLLGFVFSFIGSIPFGMINLTVVDTTIQKGLRAGIILGAGAAIIEFFQSIIAVLFTHIFIDNPHIEEVIHWLAIPIFFGLAIFHYLQSHKESTVKSSEKSLSPFHKGLFISSLNMLAIPYWVFYATYFGSTGWLSSEKIPLLYFCIGIALGAFSLFVVFAKLSSLVVKRMAKISSMTNRILALIFFILGLYQLVQMF
ncbi:MAG: LysE family transporter [Chitinophagales bacterium]